MKLAFFTPLNPIQSGISDYSEELLSAMSGATVGNRPVDIDLFIDRGYRPSSAEITAKFNVLPGRGFGKVAGQYDATIYQMGNSAAHAYIYETLLRHPGVVVMHEFVLHHLRIWMTLNGGKRKEYLSLMEKQHGSEGREAARRVMLGQFPEALFNYPLSEEAIQRATGVIVHSRYMAGLVRGVMPGVPLAVVPMGVPLPLLIEKAEARARLGLDPDLFLVTSVGHLNPYKRVSATLRAFKSLLMDVPNALYLLIGSRSPNYDPARQIEMLGLQSQVRSTGYVSQAEFQDYLAASDVSLNLRYPTAGETSASLLRIMGAGVPVLVTRTGSFEELPDDAAGKIDVGDIEEELLLEYLLLLARRPDLRAAMSEAARRYVAEHHTLEAAARGYLEFIRSQKSGVRSQEIIVPHLEQQEVESSVGRVGEVVQKGVTATPLPTPQSASPPTDLPSVLSPQSSLLTSVAAAAAELGIEEGDDTILAAIARSLEGLVPGRE
jgi:glycosyltransferase involved in cell wall biosynthesis